MHDTPSVPPFPSGLLDWAGHRSGGVRRLFHTASGRPCRVVIETPLLARLREWVDGLVAHPENTPRVVLLIGGPGNGKTEAVEDTIGTLDSRLALGGSLVREFNRQFATSGGRPVPRLARVDLVALTHDRFHGQLSVVQDASVTDAEQASRAPADLLVDDLERHAISSSESIYLACVNRGVLDDAFIAAIDQGKSEVHSLLERVIRAVGLSPTSPRCWPIDGYEHVAVWPMDVETLVGAAGHDTSVNSPAATLLEFAVDEAKWPPVATCAAGDKCPFCWSRAALSRESQRGSLLRILRWFELAAGKRWSFRDLFSLVSYLLAGATQQDGDRPLSPCEWAQRLYESSTRSTSRLEPARLSAPFVLAHALYQHALFCYWPRLSGRGLRQDLRDLNLDGDATLLGLHYFLTGTRSVSIPRTLVAQLAGLSEALDPAMAEPESPIELSTRVFRLRDMDARFSQSVGEGLDFIRRLLSPIELDLFNKLSQADERLGSPDARRRRPAVAKKLQTLVRDFACRMARRSLGVRFGIVREQRTLSAFEKVIDGDTQLLHEAVRQVEALLNDKDHFLVSLNTTFGESLPPSLRRAILLTAKQRVRPVDQATAGRPATTMRFLQVGTGSRIQHIPLTYELFRSVRELKRGLLPASLPRTVVALLDTTRARLAGQVVRDEDALDGAEIRLGTRNDVIVRELGQFVVRQGEQE